jgi:hypothetical protein
MVQFSGANRLQIPSDLRLRRRDVVIRSLRPEDANLQDESSQKKKTQLRAKKRKYGVHA